MSNHSRSLNAFVRVPALLQLLGCRAELQGLPLRTRCPICRAGLLTIYRDHASGGGWHHCADCGSSGDLIALTAATQGITRPEAIVYLGARGFNIPTDEESIRRYLQETVEYDERLAQLWQSAQASNRRPSSDFLRLAHRLGLNTDSSTKRWSDGVGQCISGLTKTAIEKAFAPQVMEHAHAKRLTGSTSEHRTFAGEDWDTVAAVPFLDLPGRISSLLFVGRNADPKRDFVLKRANRGPLGNQHLQVDAEAGLAFHPRVFEAAERTGGVILAVNDPVMMLKLQARHLRTHGEPLPIVCWIDTDQWPDWQTLGRRTRTHAAWQMFHGCRVVFWVPLEFDVFTLRQAIATDASISTAGPQFKSPKTLTEYLWKRSASDLFHHIVEQSQPWPAALSDDLTERKDGAIHRLLAQLEYEEEPLDRILTRCNPAVQQRLTRLINASVWPRTIELNGRTIVEANREWWLQRHGRPEALICNAILRVDRIVSDVGEDEGRLDFVQGRVLFNEHEIPVYSPLRDVEKNPFHYIRDVLLDHRLGLLQFDSRYSKQAMLIAARFQPPQQNEPLLRVGYDRNAGRLTLPNFTLEIGAEPEPTTGTLVPDHLPGRNLRISSDPVTVPFTALQRDTAKVCWATMAGLLANILASEFDQAPEGICLVGRGAQATGLAIAEAVGCVRLSVTRAAEVNVALEAERMHDWPVIFDCRRPLSPRQFQKLLRPQQKPRRCIVPATPLTVLGLQLAGGWTIITSHSQTQLPDAVLEEVAAFLPAYLRDLIGRWCSLEQDGEEDSLVLRILADMAAYVERKGRVPAAVRAAAELIEPGGDVDPRCVLIDLLGALLTHGMLKLAPEPDPKGAPTVVDLPRHDALLLHPGHYINALLKAHIDGAAVEDVTPLLEAGGWLRGTDRIGRWILDRARVLARWQQRGLQVASGVNDSAQTPFVWPAVDARCGYAPKAPVS